jgi:hypothetical protein
MNRRSTRLHNPDGSLRTLVNYAATNVSPQSIWLRQVIEYMHICVQFVDAEPNRPGPPLKLPPDLEPDYKPTIAAKLVSKPKPASGVSEPTSESGLDVCALFQTKHHLLILYNSTPLPNRVSESVHRLARVRRLANVRRLASARRPLNATERERHRAASTKVIMPGSTPVEPRTRVPVQVAQRDAVRHRLKRDTRRTLRYIIQVYLITYAHALFQSISRVSSLSPSRASSPAVPYACSSDGGVVPSPTIAPAPIPPRLVPDDIKAPPHILERIIPPTDMPVGQFIEHRRPIEKTEQPWGLPPGVDASVVTRDCDATQDNLGVFVRHSRLQYDLSVWFTTDAPNVHDATFFDDFVIPHEAVCRGAEHRLGEALLGGSQSVRHPSDPRLRLPLSVVRVWKWASALLRQLRRWEQPFNWIDERSVTEAWHSALSDSIRTTLQRLPRSGRVTGFGEGVTYETLVPEYLSDDLLADDRIDAAFAAIKHATPDTPSSSTVIAGARFSQALSPEATYEDREHLNTVATAFSDANRLIIPWHIRLHWMLLVLCKEVNHGVIYVADSISDDSADRKQSIMDHLIPWLKAEAPDREWLISTNRLDILQQLDGISCGPAIIDSAANHVSDGEAGIWSPTKVAALRAHLLLRCLDLDPLWEIVSLD